MEFGKHLEKGIWGIADKALPVIYGLAYVVLVIRVLPEVEFGNFVLIQEIFLIVTNLAAAFALHPLLKFGSEQGADERGINTGALVLNAAFLLPCSLLAVLLKREAALVLNAPLLEGLMDYLPAMFAANFVRNFCLVLLQARFRMQEVFWADAAHFLGAPVLIYVYSKLGLFNSALDLIHINLYSLSFSSLTGAWLSRRFLRFRMRPSRGEFRRMWDYGKFSAGTIVNYMLSTRADTFILSAFWGPVQVAVYNSVKVFVRIYDMVAQVGQMFIFPAVSRLSSQGDAASLKKLLEKGVAFMTMGLLPVFILYLFLSPLMIRIVYGDRYGEGVLMLQIFSAVCFLAPLIAVTSNNLLGLGQARLSFFLSLKTLAGSAAAFFVLIPWLGATGAAAGFVFSAALQAWLFTAASNRFTPLAWRAVQARTGDVWAFLRSAMERRPF
ncbi:MAG: oligosaccharide flippase family protein [Bacteroidota bacterium]